MKEKEVLNIQLDPIKLPRIGEIIDLLLNWYITSKNGGRTRESIEETERVLRLWGRIE